MAVLNEGGRLHYILSLLSDGQLPTTTVSKAVYLQYDLLVGTKTLYIDNKEEKESKEVTLT